MHADASPSMFTEETHIPEEARALRPWIRHGPQEQGLACNVTAADPPRISRDCSDAARGGIGAVTGRARLPIGVEHERGAAGSEPPVAVIFRAGWSKKHRPFVI